MSDLTGKVCLITGADEGIGRGVVAGFLKRGAHVAAGLLDATANAHRIAPALPVQMDVTDSDQVAAAIATTIAHFGRLDVLVNNAGIYPRMPADALTLADFRRVLDVNLEGSWRCIEASIPQFKAQGGGVVLNVGSITVRGHFPNLAHYRASKGAIEALTRALAQDLGPFGIRVNCLHPGAVLTEGELRVCPDQAAVLERVNANQCLAGRQTPESIEPTFAFLCSDASGDITGQSLAVDRGWTLGG